MLDAQESIKVLVRYGQMVIISVWLISLARETCSYKEILRNLESKSNILFLDERTLKKDP